MRKFWLFKETDGAVELRLEGEIASTSWFGDEVTPKQFMGELAKYAGRDITVWINSPGGDVVAGSQIYTALQEHDGEVTVKIDGIAASAASVVAMAGDMVEMSPTALIMIHDPMTWAFGNAEALQAGIDVLTECKEAIINAYALKTGISRAKIARLMTDETWMNARKAVELGFADKVMYSEGNEGAANVANSFLFGRMAVVNSLLAKLPTPQQETPPPEDTPSAPEPTPPDPAPPKDTAYMAEIENLILQFETI